jgi:hypothetical protein
MEDNKYFNCSQAHEAAYVATVYNDKSDKTVKEFLKEKCTSGEIKYSTHDEVYALLDKNGFTRK